MMTDKAESAARALLEAASANKLMQAFPDATAPTNIVEAYAIQDAQLVLSGEPIAAWKVGPSASDFPETCAPIIASRLLASPATLSGDLPLKAVECEVAFRLAKDLPAAHAPYNADKARDSIGTAMVAIEAVETRYIDWPVEKKIWALADNQSNQALVVGPEIPLPDPTSLGELTATLDLGGKVKAADKGFPGGDPFTLIAWLANHLANRSPILAKRGLKAGDVVTTGSWNGVDFAETGMNVIANFEGLGSASLAYM